MLFIGKTCKPKQTYINASSEKQLACFQHNVHGLLLTDQRNKLRFFSNKSFPRITPVAFISSVEKGKNAIQHTVGHSNNKHKATLQTTIMREDYYLTNTFGNHQHYSCFKKVMIKVVIKHLYLNRKYFRQKLSYQLFSVIHNILPSQGRDINMILRLALNLNITKFNKQGNYINHAK